MSARNSFQISSTVKWEVLMRELCQDCEFNEARARCICEGCIENQAA